MSNLIYCTPGHDTAVVASATAGGTMTLWQPAGTSPDFGPPPGPANAVMLTAPDNPGHPGVPLAVVHWNKHAIIVQIPTAGPGTGQKGELFTLTLTVGQTAFVVENVHIVGLPGSNGYPHGPPVHH